MDWMLEGLLQGTQLQKLYNRKIEALRVEYNLRKVDIDILNRESIILPRTLVILICLIRDIFPNLWVGW